MYRVIGYHATSLLASVEIERFGFLPHKIFGKAVHDQVIAVAHRLNLPTYYYTEWLGMRSVSFGKILDHAIVHASQGNAGGQGLMNVERLLESINAHGTDADRVVASGFAGQIQAIRTSTPVIYAVDLSNLGPRLVDDASTGYYQMFWNPSAPLPAMSEIGPERLIARFSL